MKKIAFGLLFALLLVGLPSALAADAPRVVDDAALLSREEWRSLSALADQISEEHGFDVVIVTADSMNTSDAYEHTKALYRAQSYGYGAEHSGLILFLSMEYRDYALVAFGYGNTAFTDYGKDVMLDAHILPLLGDDRYFEAFSAYLNKADEFLKMAQGGTPFDADSDPESARSSFLAKLAFTILLPLLIAGVLCLLWGSQMKTARLQRAADHYIPKDGFRLTGQEDRFLYHTVVRRKIEKPSSGGTTGTTIDSSGASGRSGKF